MKYNVTTGTQGDKSLRMDGHYRQRTIEISNERGNNNKNLNLIESHEIGGREQGQTGQSDPAEWT